MLDEFLENKNVNLSHFQSLANLQFWTFGLYHLNIWIEFMQTFGTTCLCTTYLDNYVVPACFSPFVLTLILVSCTVFIAFQWFSSVFFSSVIHLACVCIDYLHLWYTHLQFMLISGFQIFFCIIYQVQYVNKYV